jgi:trans-aconitate 2-methyltransferase
VTLAWDGRHYADHTAHHRVHDDVVLDRLRDLRADASVLDIGCGVGDFTRRLLEVVPAGSVIGVDADPSMLDVARARAGSAPVRFEQCRAQDIASFAPPATFDAVVSVACLHWVPREDHADVIHGIATLLRPGGRVVLDLGGHGQLANVRAVVDPLAHRYGGRPPQWWFPSPQQYRPMLESAGWRVEACDLLHQRRALGDRKAAIGWFTSQVLVGYLPQVDAPGRPAFAAAAGEAVADALARPDGTYAVDYVRLVVAAAAS